MLLASSPRLSVQSSVTPPALLLALLTLAACTDEIVYSDVPLPLDLNECLAEVSARLVASDGDGGAEQPPPWSVEEERGCIRLAGPTPQGCLLIEGLDGTSLALPVSLDGDGMHLLGAEAPSGELSSVESALVTLNVPEGDAPPAPGAFVFFTQGHPTSDAICAGIAVDADCDNDLGCALKVRFGVHKSPEGVVALAAPEGAGLCEWVPLSGVASEACDTLDNDCDGKIDEGVEGLGEECAVGVGKCRGRGRRVCTLEGGLVCTAQASAPMDELCDGHDNDCDDRVDEGFEGLTELCDGVDNDCDGSADEGLTDAAGNGLEAECEFGLGPCAQDGAVRCVTEGDLETFALPSSQLGAALCLPTGALVSPPVGDQDALCDGVDSDCDGYLDEGFTRSVVDCGEGACVAQGQLLCANDAGEMNTCRTGEPAPADETCDGMDDDCSGQADEDFLPTLAVCGVGECVRSGTRYCFNNAERTICTPALPLPGEADASCNNRDEDCDGLMDEGFVRATTHCGVGECSSAGERRCEEGGFEVDTCEPRAPTGNDVLCDGLDADCDGRVDEGFTPRVISCGVGVCQATGQVVCDRAASPPQERALCTPAAPPTSVDLCDGLDNDCDGLVDENHTVSTTVCGLGVCRRQGQLLCAGGALQNTCLVGSPAAGELDASCNAVDNDCDGRVDEGYTVSVTTCGDTACASEGLRLCANGQEFDTCREGTPAADDANCDGVDDDCDGSLDEDYTSTPSSCGVGLCASEGALVCSGGEVVDTCTEGLPQANDVTCDGLDQDCDGRVDESYILSTLTCGTGECRASGVRRCVAGQVQNDCTPGLPTADNTCDGKDNDCDGGVDESYPSQLISCGQGACTNSGQRLCIGGGVQDVCTPFPAAAADPVCDGVDSDCDGLVDENYAGTPVTCGAGACANTVSTICVGGAVTSMCTPNAAASSPDADCDLVDDDCDGRIDEAYMSITTTCPPGSCNATAPTICTTSGLTNTCVPAPAATDPTCNGVDDDCDGRLDEDYVAQTNGVQISCGFGVCAVTNGTLACVSGSVQPQCTPNAAASSPDTSCDGVDQDCDGRLDEAYSAVGSCGVGACARSGVSVCVDGAPQLNCTPAQPTPERCGDGVDNDCDGVVDEGFPTLGGACEAGVGACRQTGQIICNQNGDGVLCGAQPGSPSPELCNGFDDDCDGTVDNNLTDISGACVDNSLFGVCSQGSYQCNAGVRECVGDPNRATIEDPCTDSDEDCDARTPAHVRIGDEISISYPYFVQGLGAGDHLARIVYGQGDCENGGTRWFCRVRNDVLIPWCMKLNGDGSFNSYRQPKCDKNSTICCNPQETSCY